MQLHKVLRVKKKANPPLLKIGFASHLCLGRRSKIIGMRRSRYDVANAISASIFSLIYIDNRYEENSSENTRKSG